MAKLYHKMGFNSGHLFLKGDNQFEGRVTVSFPIPTGWTIPLDYTLRFITNPEFDPNQESGDLSVTGPILVNGYGVGLENGSGLKAFADYLQSNREIELIDLAQDIDIDWLEEEDPRAIQRILTGERLVRKLTFDPYNRDFSPRQHYFRRISRIDVRLDSRTRKRTRAFQYRAKLTPEQLVGIDDVYLPNSKNIGIPVWAASPLEDLTKLQNPVPKGPKVRKEKRKPRGIPAYRIAGTNADGHSLPSSGAGGNSAGCWDQETADRINKGKR